jgi:diaminopimelate epimerase
LKLTFTKMHGLGNDFVVVDALRGSISLDSASARVLADRRLGVGCDQVLLLEAAPSEQAVCRYRIFNTDGSEAEQCGNGVRCIGLYLKQAGLAPDESFTIQGPAGAVRIEPRPGDRFRVDMGPPRLEPDAVPFVAEDRQPVYRLQVGDEVLQVSVVSMGNPHAVVVVDTVRDADPAALGPAIERHERFPRGANLGFMEVVSKDHVRLRVHERGVGETLACGSGACAAVVAGRLRGMLAERVTVSLPGGDLVIEWHKEGDPVWMTGPATRVFEGTIEL